MNLSDRLEDARRRYCLRQPEHKRFRVRRAGPDYEKYCLLCKVPLNDKTPERSKAQTLRGLSDVATPVAPSREVYQKVGAEGFEPTLTGV